MRVTSALKLEGRTLDFVFLICCGYAPTRAATLSGWAIGSASRLLNTPEVLAAILSIETNCSTVIARHRTRRHLTDNDLDTPQLPVLPEAVVARPNVEPDE